MRIVVPARSISDVLELVLGGIMSSDPISSVPIPIPAIENLMVYGDGRAAYCMSRDNASRARAQSHNHRSQVVGFVRWEI